MTLTQQVVGHCELKCHFFCNLHAFYLKKFQEMLPVQPQLWSKQTSFYVLVTVFCGEHNAI